MKTWYMIIENLLYPTVVHLTSLTAPHQALCSWTVWRFFSLRICDAFTQTGWNIFLSIFFSYPQILTRSQDVGTKSWCSQVLLLPPPPPPPPGNGKLRFELRFWKFGLKFDWHTEPPLPPHTPPKKLGILTDLDVWIQHQKLEVGSQHTHTLPLPPPLPYREFGILVDLDSASKVGNSFANPPPPHHIENLGS